MLLPLVQHYFEVASNTGYIHHIAATRAAGNQNGGIAVIFVYLFFYVCLLYSFSSNCWRDGGMLGWWEPGSRENEASGWNMHRTVNKPQNKLMLKTIYTYIHANQSIQSWSIRAGTINSIEHWARDLSGGRCWFAPIHHFSDGRWFLYNILSPRAVSSLVPLPPD